MYDAGFLYGTLIGSIIVSIASTIAAVIAFLAARYLARKWIERSLGGKASKFRILDSAIHSDGFRIVLLIRSSPLHPYGLCNYFLGLTSVTLRDYTSATSTRTHDRPLPCASPSNPSGPTL